ncbi:MAG: hypothetical protein N2651_07015, partial [Fimbriimonadales bacterium]|nr:hypothetical protein [Fimbriimonadales bacterium]
MHWLNNLSLKAKLGLLAGAAVIGLTVFGIAAYTTLETVKIGGAKSHRIQLLQEAFADTVQPPANLFV